MMTKRSIFISLLSAALGLVSCVKEAPEVPAPSGDRISFSSYRRQVFTRADAALSSFDEGTKYTLLAVKHKDSEGSYLWNSEKGFTNLPQEGTEAAGHVISYEPVATFGSDPLDFFGLTYGTSETPALDAAPTDGSTPSITISEKDDRLTDLLHSNEVKSRSSAGGTVTLPFEHALAAVNFVMAKQDESADTPEERQLEEVKITEIRLDNVAESASMNLVSGIWNWSSASVGSRVVYQSSTGYPVPSDTKNLSDLTGESDILVFPNDDGVDSNNAFDASSPYKYRFPSGDESSSKGEQVIVTISLTGLQEYDPVNNTHVPMNQTLVDGTVVTNGSCTVSSPLRVYSDTDGSDQGPLHFLRNHKYTLSVFVMRDNVRIVAVSPQVYEWVDVNVTEGASVSQGDILGQPVTFGDVVWMDRNLGATSADCENDWLHTLGYWYEYARNIPFIMDIDVYKEKGYKINVSNGYYIVDSEGALVRADLPSAENEFTTWKDGFIYTYDNEGKRVSSFVASTINRLKNFDEFKDLPARQVLAIDPGDKGSYAFAWWNSKSWDSGSSERSYWYYSSLNSWSTTYWKEVSQQPVPKGWRLPNAGDVYSIMPEDTFDWYTSSDRFDSVGVPTPKATSGTAKTYAGDYKYQFFYGNRVVDPAADPEEEFSAPIKKSDKLTRLYGIKYQGTSRAYRYLIEMHDSDVQNARFVRFSQFPTTADDIFKKEGDNWNLHQFDWEHPSAYLDFPLQGQMGNRGAISLFGREIKIRLQNNSGWTSNYCMKLSNNGTGFYDTYMSTTCPTRLVRDTDAK